MKEKYKVDDLITGNVSSVSSSDLIYNESKEVFIFERQKERILSGSKKRIYREIFTELEISLGSDNDENDFYFANLDKSYIVNDRSLTHSDLLTNEEKTSGVIFKLRLLELYNNLNFKRTTSHSKVYIQTKQRKRG